MEAGSHISERQDNNTDSKPDDDYLDIQITDMESYANVKLKEIKVEIAAEVETTTATQPEDSNALHTFTVAWDGFETTFTKYLPEFEKIRKQQLF